MPNDPYQDAAGFMRAENYELAIVEFDDQGRCYSQKDETSPNQLQVVSDALEDIRNTKKDVILLVFVHGWKHDARSDDKNLSSFREVLDRTGSHEQACAEPGKARKVLGVFVGWRGMSAFGPVDFVASTTFWGRQEAGHRVATGSVRELFGRMRHYRNSRLKHGGSPLLVIAGHSFGGMIVYSALAQSLIEAASAPAGHIISGFADLVLLLNPAIEGARYLPIHDLKIGTAFKNREVEQLPILICVQARNDDAVGTWFPIGNLKNQIEEASIGDLEKRCISHGIGFIGEFHTHGIAGPSGENPFDLMPPQVRQTDPFWIVSATKEVVDGHSGIWQAPLLSFVSAVLLQHVNLSKAVPVSKAADASGKAVAAVRADEAPPSAAGNLADFARTISNPLTVRSPDAAN